MRCEKLLLLVAGSISLDCKDFNKKDLSALTGTWQAVDGDDLYIFNLCGNSRLCKDGLLCRGSLGSTDTKIIVASNHEPKYHTADSPSVLFYVEDEENNSVETEIAIDFICGHRPLGASFPPELVIKDEERLHFEWRTSTACSNVPKTQLSKCYTINDKNEIIDLGRLADTVYNITSPGDNTIFYTMCSKLPASPDYPSDCEGKAGCMIDHTGNLQSSFDESPLPKFNSLTGQTELNYYGHKDGSCSYQFSVFLEFPHIAREHAPVFLASSSVGSQECIINILHQTATARPVTDTSSKTCRFSEASIGKQIDLAKEFDNNIFSVHDFSISLCSENPDCGGGKVNCQIDGDKKTSLGTFYNSFYMGEVFTIVYRDGDTCGDKGMKYDSIININCVDAKDNQPEPKLLGKSDDECSYIFQWDRNEACLEKIETSCGILPVGYDFSSIQRKPHNMGDKVGFELNETGDLFTIDGDKCHLPFKYKDSKHTYTYKSCTSYGHNGRFWCCLDEECDSASSNFGYCHKSSHANYVKEDWEVSGVDNDAMFISLCGNLIRSDASKDCPEDSLFCLKSKPDLTATNIGSINELASGHLEYVLKGPSLTVHVQLSCSPGGHSSYPEFFSANEEYSEIHLLWRTAAACKVQQLIGHSCQISTDDGITIDLNQLAGTRNVGDDLKISICEDGLQEGCGNLEGGSGVGACANLDSTQTPIGQTNQTIIFEDGIVRLEMKSETSENVGLEVLFICDETAEDGSPVLLGSLKKGTKATVEWRTTAACPPLPLACSLFEHGNLIDLSSLRKWDGTAYEAMDLSGFNSGETEHKERRVLANLCGEIFPAVDENCPYGSIACEPEKKISYGQASLQSITREDRAIVARYKKGSPCKEGFWSSKFLIYCNTFDPDRTPRLRSTNETTCEAEFEWSTPHACAIPTKALPGCEVKDSRTGQMFNFAALGKKSEIERFNSITGKNYTMRMCGMSSFCCGSSSACDIAICETADQKATAYASSSEIKIIEDGVQLTYRGQTITVTVDFICDRSKGHVEMNMDNLKELSVSENKWMFEYRTALACPAMAAMCTAHDRENGMHFDLSSLSGVTLDAQDTDTWDGKEYALSLCGGLPDHTIVPLSNFNKCQSDVISYQQGYFIENFYHKNDSECYSLGTIQSQPHVSHSKVTNATALSIDMFGGSKCKSDPELSYSAVIRMTCAAFPHELEFDAASGCEQWFSIRHPAACAVSQASSEYGDCKVTEPNFGAVFDLNELNIPSGYTVKDENDKEFKFQVCGKISDCDGGVCIKNGGGEWEKFAGFSEGIYYINQVAHLTYISGDYCDDEDINYSVTLEFECAHNGTAEPYVLRNDHCHLVIAFPTTVMCPQVTEIECDFYSKISAHGFDLNPLSRNDGNHRITRWNENGTPVQYVLNICRNVVAGKDVLCPSNAGACLIRPDSQNSQKLEYINLGDITDDSAPVDITQCNKEDCGDSTLKITYASGDKCEGSDDKRTTIIFLYCDQGSIMTSPEYISDDGCVTQFSWKSEYACPIESSEAEPCTGKNPVTKQEFDLNTLFSSQQGGLMILEDTVEYHFSISCNEINTVCPKGSGACMKKKGKNAISIGQFNKRVVYNHGGLTLTYSNGDKCPNKDVPTYSTLIQFICDRDAIDLPKASIVTQTHGGCHTQIVVHTSKICEISAECAAQQTGGYLVDFSSLIPRHGHDLVGGIDKDSEYPSESIYMNICGAMEPIKRVNCPPGTSVCRWVHGQGQPPVSIGDYDPTAEWNWEEGGSPTIIYKSKTACGKPGIFYNTKIELTCNPTHTKMDPQLMAFEEETCTFLISIGNSLVCSDDVHNEEEVPSTNVDVPQMKNCIIEDDIKNIFFDFNTLGDGSFKDGEYDYKFNLCSGINDGDCSDSAFCRRKTGDTTDPWSSVGQISGVKVDHELDLADGIVLEMTFSDGQPCIDQPDKNYHTTIWFSCQQHDDVTIPVVVSSGKCSVVLSWNTYAVCEKVVVDDDQTHDKLIDPDSVRQCVFTDKEGSLTYDLSILNRVSESWQILTSAGPFLFNPCGLVHKPNLDAGCRGAMACSRLEKNGKWSTISGFAIPKAIWKAETLTLSYDKGQDSACSRRDQTPQMEIEFECGKTIGQPQLINPFPDSSCRYAIKWKTSVACRAKDTPVIMEGYDYVDPVTDQKINLISNMTFLVSGDIREHTAYRYLINLGNEMDWSKYSKNPSQSMRDECAGAAICQVHENIAKAVGKWDKSVTATSDGRVLEVHLSPQNNCKTIFNIVCDTEAKQDHLVFLDETKSCVIRFEWYTNQTCSGEIMAMSSGKPSHIGILALLVICSLSLVFFVWKKGTRIRRIAQIFQDRFRTISYTPISHDDDGDDLLFEIENVDDQVFPLVPDSLVDRAGLDVIPESHAESRPGVLGDPLGATYRDDPLDSDEDLLV